MILGATAHGCVALQKCGRLHRSVTELLTAVPMCPVRTENSFAPFAANFVLLFLLMRHSAGPLLRRRVFFPAVSNDATKQPLCGMWGIGEWDAP